ncbi:MAG: hypothetical protein S0880_36910, partial [Actinomycetota bacterium]|nr:hypothetical protein [Actinomycetota bacterium]
MFDIEMRDVLGDPPDQVIGARLLFGVDETTGGRTSVLLCTTEMSHDRSLLLSMERLERTRIEADAEITIDASAARGEISTTSRFGFTTHDSVDAAHLALRYDTTMHTVSGTVRVSGRSGRTLRCEFDGVLRARRVEALRASLRPPKLSGRWRRVGGPTELFDLSGGIPGAASWTATDSPRPDGAFARVRSAAGDRGFVRLVPSRLIGVGLVDSSGGSPAELVVAVPEEPPSQHLDDLSIDDREVLRFLAQELVIASRHAEAVPLLSRAAELYEDAAATALRPARESELIGRAMLLNYQLLAALGTRRYGDLLDLLREGVRLRHRLSFSESTLSAEALAASVSETLERASGTIDDVREVLQPLGGDHDWATGIMRLLSDAVERLGQAAGILTVAPPGDLALLRQEEVDGLIESLERERSWLEAQVDVVLAHVEGEPSLAALIDERRLIVEALGQADTWGNEALVEFGRRDDALVEAITSARAPTTNRQRFLAGFWTASALQSAAGFVRLAIEDIVRRRPVETARARRESNRSGSGHLASYVEQWRALVHGDLAKIATVDAAVPFFEELVSLLLDLDAPEDALVASELARARAFADGLAASTGRSSATVVDAASIERTVRDAQRTIIEYFAAPAAMTIWVVPPSGVVDCVTRRMDRRTVEAVVERFHELAGISVPDATSLRELRSVLRQLGEIFWDPIPQAWLPDDPDEVVTIVPHGSGSRVPFPGLLDRDGRYLGSSDFGGGDLVEEGPVGSACVEQDSDAVVAEGPEPEPDA